MKKIFSIGAALLMAGSMMAQEDQHEAVDLGLGVRWATTNIGASKPEEVGTFFAWGATSPSNYYICSGYKFNGRALEDECTNFMNKYQIEDRWYEGVWYVKMGEDDQGHPVYSFVGDGKSVLDPVDDAAAVNWGGKWRMPTRQELDTLIKSCVWTKYEEEGRNGWMLTGPNGNSIFIPCSGYANGDEKLSTNNAYLWSSTLFQTYNAYAAEITGDPMSLHLSIYRWQGVPVRPVLDEEWTPEEEKVEEGTALPGQFSIEKDQKVCFAAGNLQHNHNTMEWRMAQNQYDCIGMDNINYFSKSLDWRDLFSWSTDQTYYGYIFTDADTAVDGDFVDWGRLMGDQWFTLSDSEWKYLLNSRANAGELAGIGCIDGVNGMILLPDNWTTPNGLTFNPGQSTGYDNEEYTKKNNYTAEQWNRMETAGAVFLPAAGARYNLEIGGVMNGGTYWCNNRYQYPDMEVEGAFFLSFGADHRELNFSAENNMLSPGRSVRLVRLATTPTAIEDITDDRNTSIHKTMVNGQLLIIKDGIRYNAQGQVVE